MTTPATPTPADPTQAQRASTFLARHRGPPRCSSPTRGTPGRPRSWPPSASRPWPRPAAGSPPPSAGSTARVTRDEAIAHAASMVGGDRAAGVGRPGERLRRRPGRRRRDDPPGRSTPGWPAARSRTSAADGGGPIYELEPGPGAGRGRRRGRPRGPVHLVLTARAENHLHGRPATWPTPSPGCRPTRRRAPTSSTPRG